MAKKTAPAQESRTFEDLIEETEALAEKIERGELSLDESIGAYEKGIGNLRSCNELLKKAEEKVMMLLEGNSGFQLSPLDPDTAGNDDDGDVDA